MTNSLFLYKYVSRGVLFALIVSLFFILPGHSYAADIVVTSTDDVTVGTSSDCTLRDAIEAANTDQASGGCAAGSGRDTIRFEFRSSSLPRTIALIAQLPKIYRDVTINGPGASNLIIDGDGSSRIFHITAVSVSISGMTLQNGGGHGPQTDTHGGAIAIFGGKVELSKMSFKNNISAAGGGAIYLHSGIGFQGSLSIIACNFENNEARTNGWTNTGGGAIYAIGNEFELSVTHSSFINNVTEVDSSYHAQVLATLGSHGGAMIIIPMLEESSSKVNLQTSTFSGNKADGNGGAIAFISPQGLQTRVLTTIASLTVTNNTADSNNNAQGLGGGIFGQAAKTKIINTIVAKNQQLGSTPNFNAPDILGRYRSQGYNLIGDEGLNSSGFTGTADQIGTPASPIDPSLSQLADNGGMGQTHLPKATSTVVDKGKCSNSSDDQRFVRRPVELPVPNAPGGNGCDIGAIELTEEEYREQL